jgi:hypothetical protein
LCLSLSLPTSFSAFARITDIFDSCCRQDCTGRIQRHSDGSINRFECMMASTSSRKTTGGLNQLANGIHGTMCIRAPMTRAKGNLHMVSCATTNAARLKCVVDVSLTSQCYPVDPAFTVMCSHSCLHQVAGKIKALPRRRCLLIEP